MTAAELAQALAARIETLARDLLLEGRRAGHEWRAGSVRGEAGHSLGVRLTGTRAGVWSDFATGEAGDALDLVAAVMDIDLPEAMAWARRWLGIDDGKLELPQPPGIGADRARTRS